WTFVSSYLRSLILISLMFVPLLVAIQALPRLALGLLHGLPSNRLSLVAMTAAILLLIAITYLGVARPVSKKSSHLWLSGNAAFRWIMLLPLTIAAFAILLIHPQTLRYETYTTLAIALAAASLSSSTIYIIRLAFHHQLKRR